MNNNSKSADTSSKSNIDLGRNRKQRIKVFRGIQEGKGESIANIEVAVNMLVDKALDLEGVPQIK